MTWPKLAKSREEIRNETSAGETEYCLAQSPIGELSGLSTSPCGFGSAGEPGIALHTWLQPFMESSPEALVNFFNIFLFLANQAWMEFGNKDKEVPPDGSRSLRVVSDKGKSTLIPDISPGAIIGISILLLYTWRYYMGSQSTHGVHRGGRGNSMPLP